jgi:diphthine-ammonia ligase
MGEPFLGRLIDEDLINKMEATGVDVCGENGEYHTLVVNCPLFAQEIKVQFGNKNHHGKYWFIEMK